MKCHEKNGHEYLWQISRASLAYLPSRSRHMASKTHRRVQFNDALSYADSGTPQTMHARQYLAVAFYDHLYYTDCFCRGGISHHSQVSKSTLMPGIVKIDIFIEIRNRWYGLYIIGQGLRHRNLSGEILPPPPSSLKIAGNMPQATQSISVSDECGQSKNAAHSIYEQEVTKRHEISNQSASGK